VVILAHVVSVLIWGVHAAISSVPVVTDALTTNQTGIRGTVDTVAVGWSGTA
jgi:hypothetical protein